MVKSSQAVGKRSSNLTKAANARRGQAGASALTGKGFAPHVELAQTIVPAAQFGELVQRHACLLGVGQHHRHGKVRHGQAVADQPLAAGKMAVQDGREPVEAGQRLVNRGLVRRAYGEAGLDDVFKIERAAVPIKMLGVPAQPADHLDLADDIVGP